MRTKILLSIAILFFAETTLNAQVHKDRVLLGGSLNYSNTSNPTRHSFYSNLQIGKVIKENTVIGLIGSYSNDIYSSSFKITSYSAGIFYRKYKMLLTNFYFFAEAEGLYSYSNNVQESYNGGQYLRSSSRGVTISLIPGISYAVWKKLQMELSIPSFAILSYSHVTTINSSLPAGFSPQKSDHYAAGVNLNSNLLSNFAIGFKFLLGKK